MTLKKLELTPFINSKIFIPMKTKITLLIGAVALVTLSFTFANVDKRAVKSPTEQTHSNHSAPIGGLIADEVVK